MRLMKRTSFPVVRALPVSLFLSAVLIATTAVAQPQKPVLHGKHWMAITGKPLGATAGAMIFNQGGNAVDAACAMLGATATMFDALSWGGETQALIWHPEQKKVIGINALGVAPTGATPEFFRGQGMDYPPSVGPLAAVTPGTPGGLLTMLAEYGTMSLAQVLAPAIQMADGYPIEASAARAIQRGADRIAEWPYSARTLLPHRDERAAASGPQDETGNYWDREDSATRDFDAGGPLPGENFRQPELAATLRKLVDAEAEALAAGKDRKEAIHAAYDRFYKGDIAEEFARGVQEQGGLITTEDLANWKVHIEEPVSTNYKGIEVYKLTHWVQSPVLLQTLNIVEPIDLKGMGYNSSRYIHTLYQAISLAFADRDFYYGDPYFPPEEPIQGLLSKEYARHRAELIRDDRNDPTIGPVTPYPFQGGENPFREYLDRFLRDIGDADHRGGAAGVPRRIPGWHDLHPGGGRFRLGGVRDPERRLVAGGVGGRDRNRPQPADAELRPRPGDEPLQRPRARKAAARHPDAEPRGQGRGARSFPLRSRAATARTRISCSSS